MWRRTGSNRPPSICLCAPCVNRSDFDQNEVLPLKPYRNSRIHSNVAAQMSQTYPRISRQAWWRWLHGCGSPPRPEPCFAWLSGRSRLWRIPWFCPGSLPGSPALCSLHWTETKPVKHSKWHWLRHLLTSYPFSNVAHLQPRWLDGHPLRGQHL